MRSVSVVLPASMCAAMPMLRVRSSGNARSGELGLLVIGGSASAVAITFSSRNKSYRGASFSLPAEVSKRAVGLSHLVGVVALLDRAPLPRRGVFQFRRERVRHRNVLARLRVCDDP